MTGPEEHAIEIDGRSYAWRSVGDGPPLILLNGYSGTAQDWDPTLLGELGGAFTVICPDHRGMGASGLGDPDGVTIDSMAADVTRLLDALELESAPVAGWSMGGFVTQQIARHDPSRVDAMILMGTDPGGSAAVRATAETWGRLTDHSGTPREQASRMIALLFPPALAPAIDAAFGDLIAEARAALSPEALAAQQRAMAAWHDADQPAPIAGTAPRALVLHGTEDVVIPPQNADALAAVWPTCTVDTFAGGGHAFFALEPQGVAASIVAFCRDEVVSDWDVTISDAESPADAAELRDALHEYNYEVTGYRDGRALSCYLHHDGKLVAGIDGFTWGGYARIDYLWVADDRRGRGLGTRLMDAAEEEARRRGCVTIVLDTHSFQAPALYRTRGYREVGTTTDTPRGHTQTAFQKSL